MQPFLGDDFLLENETARQLYHHFAAMMPIIDYHSHLDPRAIYENHAFASLAELWLYGDHYKWRAMRANGIEERYVTGGEGVDDYARFCAWAGTVPQAIGNPLYHWSHLELRRYFGISEIIHTGNAAVIWEKANTQLGEGGYRVRDFLQCSNVEVLCTTDDPVDTLDYHRLIAADSSISVQVLPTFRPDQALRISQGSFTSWVRQLGEAAGIEIGNYHDFLQALALRVDYFHAHGCRLSDHALDTVPYVEGTLEEAAGAFAKRMRGTALEAKEAEQFQARTMLELGKLYVRQGWAMQLHIHAQRNNNARMYARLGPDTGYDSMNDRPLAEKLGSLLNALDEGGHLPKTIVYSLNARDNEVLAALIGSFQGGVPGKLQLGSAWWFNDTKDGMLAQLKSLANFGLLGRFIGMLTDSRSFLSFTRHEYFRRILCNLLGEWVERGEVPNDLEWLGTIVQNIAYRNAQAYFGFAKRQD